MKWHSSLQPATLVKRYKRFLADVILADGTPATVHCPNTGSMKSCGEPGQKVWLSSSANKSRKYPLTWEYTETAKGLIGINTHLPNRLVKEALLQRTLPEFEEISNWQSEQKSSHSRIDFKAEISPTQSVWLEVKNVTLYQNETLLFPDAETKRGQKHLIELMKLHDQGQLAYLLFVINRPEPGPLHLADHIDPEYSKLARLAHQNGVQFIAYRVQPGTEQSVLSSQRVAIEW